MSVGHIRRCYSCTHEETGPAAKKAGIGSIDFARRRRPAFLGEERHAGPSAFRRRPPCPPGSAAASRCPVVNGRWQLHRPTNYARSNAFHWQLDTAEDNRSPTKPAACRAASGKRALRREGDGKRSQRR
ncbi:hypothetical protein MRX96_031160 [Rhipicephalus microplus]